MKVARKIPKRAMTKTKNFCSPYWEKGKRN